MSRPVIRLNKVDLPEPLGPTMQQISPLFTESVSSSTATSPPKRLLTASMLSMGLAFATGLPAPFIGIEGAPALASGPP
jgi:hypothetical protein